MRRPGWFATPAAVVTAVLCLYAWVFAPVQRAAAQEETQRAVYRSPFDLAFSPDGRTLAVSDRTAGSLVLIDASRGQVTGEVELEGRPSGVTWSADGRLVYVAQCTAGTVAEIEPAGKTITRRLKVDPWPVGLAIAPRRGWLLAANSATHTVSVVELAGGRELARLDVLRTPYFLAVTLIDLGRLAKVTDIRLPRNSTNVHSIAVSPDGKWAYVLHNLGRTALPTEQIEYGWINANAMTIIDLAERKLFTTVLLDQPTHGAANPWGAAISADGSMLWITLAGVHQLGRLDLAKLHAFLNRRLSEIARRHGETAAGGAPVEVTYGTQGSLHVKPEEAAERHPIEIVTSDELVQYGAGVYPKGAFERIDLPGNGPRGLALSPHGRRLAAAMYFSGIWGAVPTRLPWACWKQRETRHSWPRQAWPWHPLNGESGSDPEVIPPAILDPTWRLPAGRPG